MASHQEHPCHLFFRSFLGRFRKKVFPLESPKVGSSSPPAVAEGFLPVRLQLREYCTVFDKVSLMFDKVFLFFSAIRLFLLIFDKAAWLPLYRKTAVSLSFNRSTLRTNWIFSHNYSLTFWFLCCNWFIVVLIILWPIYF